MVFFSEWFPDSIVSAQAVMQYNLAVVKTLRGQLDQAAALLKQVWKTRSQTNPVPAHIIMLVLYIELKLGWFSKWYLKDIFLRRNL